MDATPADRLFALVARTRFRAPGTSSDPYLDALVMWLTVVREAREALRGSGSLREVERVYRDSVERWLNGEPVGEDTALRERFRAAVGG